MKTITIEVPDGKNAKWVNGVLTIVDEQYNPPVTERIKTFEDACRELDKRAESNEGIALLLADYESNADNIKTNSTKAYMKLCIIAAALNEGWEPKFTTGEYRYYPWFCLYTQKEIDKMDEEKKKSLVLFGGGSHDGAACGLASADSADAWAAANSCISARLAVKTDELAEYFGKQFIDIWADYVLQPQVEY